MAAFEVNPVSVIIILVKPVTAVGVNWMVTFALVAPAADEGTPAGKATLRALKVGLTAG
jgi:hypothetical protein